MRDHTEVVEALRAQDSTRRLIVEVPDAETMVFDLMQEAAKMIHERCMVAAEDAASKLGTSNISVHEARGAHRVIDAIRCIRTEV